jgi:hypothetical protein
MFRHRLKGRYHLIKNMNCALATLEALQDITGKRDDRILKAVTGLEGGVVASGSTCGVLTGGAIALSQMYENALGGDASTKALLLSQVARYVDWFGLNFKTTLCRERSRVDFWTAGGQLRYSMPGDRVLRCFNHIGKAVEFLAESQNNYTEDSITTTGADFDTTPYHCAASVLREVKEQTGIGDPEIFRLTTVLDGGVGLTGGVCGALAGAVMAINTLVGMEIRNMGRFSIMDAFILGHANLLRKEPRRMPEPFGVGKEIVSRFLEGTGFLECKEIVGRKFTDYGDFLRYRKDQGGCDDLIARCSNLAIEALRPYV